MIRKSHLKKVAQTADVPKDLQYRVGILRTFESASPHWVITQLFDLIYLKVDGPEEDSSRRHRQNVRPDIQAKVFNPVN